MYLYTYYYNSLLSITVLLHDYKMEAELQYSILYIIQSNRTIYSIVYT